jgi:hypothetical protein
MMKRYIAVLGILGALAGFGASANAQGLVGGAQEGAAEGNRALGPIGGIVGGAIGAGVGTVNGALGIRPYWHRRACYVRHGRRHCRYW